MGLEVWYFVEGKCRWHFVCSPSYNQHFLVFLNVFRHCVPWIALQQFASQWIAKVSIIANLGRDIPLRQPSSFEINPTTSNLLVPYDLPWKLSPSQYGAHSNVLWLYQWKYFTWICIFSQYKKGEKYILYTSLALSISLPLYKPL